MEHEPTGPSDGVESLREPLSALASGGRLKAALEMVEKARASFPLDPWLATFQAYAFLRMAEIDNAGRVALEALNLGSEDPLAWLVLGIARRKRGRHDEAAQALLIAHQGFPERLDAATMLIEETAAAHGMEAGRQAYEEALARLPGHALTLHWARMLFAVDQDQPLPPGFVSAPVMSVPAWAAQAGSALDWVGEREMCPIEDPPIFGEPTADRFKAVVPGYVAYVTALRNATIFSKSSIVLTADGHALSDTIADERFGRFIKVPNPDHPFEEGVVARKDGRLLLDTTRYDMAELEAGVMLSGAASEHFGHWVPEYVSRLSYFERHPRFADLPIIVDADMPPQHVEYLSLLVSNPIVRIPAGGALRVGELIVASPTTFLPVHLTPKHQVPPENQGGTTADCMRYLQERIRERMGESEIRGRKLYLPRRNSTWRRLINEEEISTALAARGFEVLYPEEMTFAEQVRMFQSAGVVVAPNGSSLANAIFAPTDTKLIVLSQRGLFNWGTFNGFMHELGYDLTFVCGDGKATNDKHSDYTIRPADLLEALEAVTSPPSLT